MFSEWVRGNWILLFEDSIPVNLETKLIFMFSLLFSETLELIVYDLFSASQDLVSKLLISV
jgi:hypothetical protein